MKNTILLSLALVLFASPVTAATVEFDSSIEFSGGTAPVGVPPWLKATFDDGGGSGKVNLKFEATNLTGTEFVSNLYFNLDPALDPTQLVFGAVSKTGTFDDPTFDTGKDAFKADGDGNYDLLVEFSNAPPGTRFGAGDALSVDISGIASLTASSFNFLSAPAGGHGPFYTAAHVQAIGAAGGSGWVTVPEPATWILGSLASVGAALGSRRRRRRGS